MKRLEKAQLMCQKKRAGSVRALDRPKPAGENRQMNKPISHFFADCKLDADGWLSPDTYGREFATAGDFPAVYMFMQVDFDLMESRDYKREIVYVGMSSSLARRWAAHPTLRKIKAEGLWVKRLFKPTPEGILRAEERRYIQQFRPRWNVIGRVPGQ